MGDISREPTGIEGLDTILGGGLLRQQNALVRGPPGVGKTVFGLHFLAAAGDDEESLYINFGEPTEYVKRTADYFGLNSDSLNFLELAPTADRFAEEEMYTLFSSSDVEQPSLINEVRETVEALQPDRVLIDPITEFRFLTADEHQFRSQIMGLIDFLRGEGATVLMTSQVASDLSDTDLRFLTDVIIDLDRTADARSIDVTKFRGPPVKRGPHGYEITESGIEVWPRLVPTQAPVDFESGTISSGVPELDQLLNGGLQRGTVTFFSGPTGAGKTTTSLQFVKEAASRGNQSLILSFEESTRTMLQRSEALNIGLSHMIDQGNVEIVAVRPDEYTVDQVTNMIETAVTDDGVGIVLLDGFEGFKQNLRGFGDEKPVDYLSSIGHYLRERGVTTIVTNEVHQITGEFRVTEEAMSNVADNIIFLRHLEYQGSIDKVIGVLKMRTSDFEDTLRRLDFTEYGISVGEPLTELSGILTGTPTFDRSRESGADDT